MHPTSLGVCVSAAAPAVQSVIDQALARHRWFEYGPKVCGQVRDALLGTYVWPTDMERWVHSSYDKFLEWGCLPSAIMVDDHWNFVMRVEHVLASPLDIFFGIGAKDPVTDKVGLLATMSPSLFWRGVCVARGSTFADLAVAALASGVFNPDQMAAVVRYLRVAASCWDPSGPDVLTAVAAAPECPWVLRVLHRLRGAAITADMADVLRPAMAAGWSLPRCFMRSPNHVVPWLQFRYQPPGKPVGVAYLLAAGLDPEDVVAYTESGESGRGAYELCLLAGAGVCPGLMTHACTHKYGIVANTVCAWPLWVDQGHCFATDTWRAGCDSRWRPSRSAWARATTD
jgi:hypothetical protein